MKYFCSVNTVFVWFCSGILLCLLAFVSCKKQDGGQSFPPSPGQPVPITLKASSFILGNGAKAITDSFVLEFNKPVTVKYILFKRQWCLPDLGYKIVDGGKTVRFGGFKCGYLGSEDYTFEYSVVGDSGMSKIDSVSFNAFSRKEKTVGYTTHFYLTDDNQYCWVCTRQPNQLIRFKVADATSRSVYDLNFAPWKLHFNPYNNKLYISAYGSDSSNKIFVFNPSTGTVDKTITLSTDSYDYSAAGRVQVNDLTFGANGYGCVCYGFNGTSALRWKVLDSRFNDTVYPHAKWLQAASYTADSKFLDLGKPLPNYNKSKIYLSANYGTPTNGVLNCTTQDISLVTQPVPAYHIMARMSKTDDRIYIFDTYNQYIMNEAGIKGNSSGYSGTIGPTSADFTYRPNEQNFVYMHGESSGINFLDYGNTVWLNNIRTTSDTKQIETTTDGKLLIFRQNNAIVFVNTDWFYKYL